MFRPLFFLGHHQFVRILMSGKLHNVYSVVSVSLSRLNDGLNLQIQHYIHCRVSLTQGYLRTDDGLRKIKAETCSRFKNFIL